MGLLNQVNANNEKQPMADRFRIFAFEQKSCSRSRGFLFYSVVTLNNYISTNTYIYYFRNKESNFFAYSRVFEDHEPNLRTFQGLGFFPQFQDFPGFLRTTATSDNVLVTATLYFTSTFALLSAPLWKCMVVESAHKLNDQGQKVLNEWFQTKILKLSQPYACKPMCSNRSHYPGLSIRFEVDGDILKVDSYDGQRQWVNEWVSEVAGDFRQSLSRR